MRWVGAWALGLIGCVSVETSNPVLNVGAAVAAAAVSRARGGCLAQCTNGTACNEDNGQCELPCDGACHDSEVCTAQNVCAPAFVWTATSSQPHP